jgi:hypothetical protein
MKHVKKVSKVASPSRAFVWDWFVNIKGGFTPGLINTAKAGYANALWASDDSLDPEDVYDVGLF